MMSAKPIFAPRSGEGRGILSARTVAIPPWP
jgi:hypothetical protein